MANRVDMSSHQPGILEPVPRVARYLTFQLVPGADPRASLERLSRRTLGPQLVVGIGSATAVRLDKRVDGLRECPPLTGPGAVVPSDPSALLFWLRGDDSGELLHRGRELSREVADAFVLDSATDAFMYAGGRDLTGYEDGTENPTGDKALAAAFVSGVGPGKDGSSFVVVQRWRHDLDCFEAKSPAERDLTIGRQKSDNEELGDAPATAHVKRAAQESFEPEAFVLRRSMPWAAGAEQGLVFVAFGRSFDAFEALSRRMVGLEDGITDALFSFTRPLTSSYFWCPPLAEGQLDLRLLGI
jgi:putative iron-dependent peroxidase